MLPTKRKIPSRFDYEKHLNDFYKETYSDKKAGELLDYLTVSSRTPRFARKHRLLASIANGRSGFLIRKYDSIAFNVGYREYMQNY